MKLRIAMNMKGRAAGRSRDVANVCTMGWMRQVLLVQGSWSEAERFASVRRDRKHSGGNIELVARHRKRPKRAGTAHRARASRSGHCRTRRAAMHRGSWTEDCSIRSRIETNRWSPARRRSSLANVIGLDDCSPMKRAMNSGCDASLLVRDNRHRRDRCCRRHRLGSLDPCCPTLNCLFVNTNPRVGSVQ